jgi:hypothetical protein
VPPYGGLNAKPRSTNVVIHCERSITAEHAFEHSFNSWSCVIALGLLSAGAGLDIKAAKEAWGPVLPSTFIKLLLVPLLTLWIRVSLGIHGPALTTLALFIVAMHLIGGHYGKAVRRSRYRSDCAGGNHHAASAIHFALLNCVPAGSGAGQLASVIESESR